MRIDCEAPQRKRERRDSKNKVTKTCRKENLFGKNNQQGNGQKKSEIFLDKKNREEIFPFFYRKLQTTKKH